MRMIVLAAAGFCLASEVAAQVATPPRKPIEVAKPKDSVTATEWRPYGFALFSSEVMDSNIEREKEGAIGSNGFVLGALARFTSAEVRPAVQLAYEIATHSYTHSEQYDRISHNLSAVLSRRFSKKLIAEVITEAALKGSSEDRDVGNQYIVLPRLNYRLTPGHRLRTYGAYRIRRYDTSADRDAVNRYVGTELRSDIGNDSRLEFGARYETNSARAARRSYTRRTFHTAYTRNVGDSDDFLAGLKYRSQRYDKRPVSEDDDNPRHDHRFSPTVEWGHRFGGGFSLIGNYEFEYRSSNDPDNGYRDHVFALTARYDW